MDRKTGVVDRALERIEQQAGIGEAVRSVTQLLATQSLAERARWLIYMLAALGPLEAEPNQHRAAAARLRVMNRVANVIGSLADLLAEEPAEAQAVWLARILATLDPCTAGPDDFGRDVLQPVAQAISRRLETGLW